ncbi:MAG TPA: hypothetical protein VGL62_13675 [Vicinamibacterales bacterium]
MNISAPQPMQPASGAKISVGNPITLVVDNATTTGVRPLSYDFEVASDQGFQAKVFAQNGVAPGSGQTSVRLPDALAADHTYYWHAMAADGANSGDFSNAVPFTVFTPVVLQAPAPTAPVNNSVISPAQPGFQWTDAARSGPAGTVIYTVQVALDQAFSSGVQSWTAPEQPNATSFTAPATLTSGAQYYWRVAASTSDSTGATVAGAWSATQPFRTMAGASTPPPSTPPPSGGGGAASDMMNLGSAQVYNSPGDIASWAVTGKITQLAMSPSSGLTFQFTTSGSWPDYTPPGWDGPLQYTVWAVVNINGTWYTSGFIQMWRDRGSTGGPILTNFANNWAYDARWGPMQGYQPHAGEQMGFFLSAGNARGEGGVTSVRERTNVVVVSLPAGDSGIFNF